MSWFKRVKEGILTRTEEKTEAPDGLWSKCPECKKAIHARALEESFHVCTECNYHFKIGSAEYFTILFGAESEYTILFKQLEPADPLKFSDTKKYTDRVKDSKKKTGMEEAMQVAHGKLMGEVDLVVACMDFRYIGGSMGSVMGEKISRAIDFALEHKMPLMIISKSGGARMMEGAFSLMQMAKVSAKLTLLDREKIPFFSLLTDPTTGGVTASFAMLGDFNIAEPGSLIGFAGPRVIRETIGKDLPKGFQTAEFVMDHGFLDLIVDRRELPQKIVNLIKMLK